MRTLKVGPNGSFKVGYTSSGIPREVEYQKGDLEVVRNVANETVALLRAGETATETNLLKYDQYVNPVTGLAFTTYAALDAWLSANLFVGTSAGAGDAIAMAKFNKKRNINQDWAVRNEARGLHFRYNSKGLWPLAATTTAVDSVNDWRTAVAPTVVAYRWNYAVNGGFGLLAVRAGRRYVVKKVIVQTTTPCEILLQVVKQTIGTAAPSANLTGENDYRYYQQTQDNATGGSKVFDFGDSGMVLRGGERLDFKYMVSGTVGIIYDVQIWADDITDDENYQSKFWLAILGDSIASVAAPDAPRLLKRNGVTTGVWGYILQRNLFEQGVDSHLAIMPHAGDTTQNIESMVSVGKLAYCDLYDILILNTGMNDAEVDTGLSPAGGADGTAKLALKSIVMEYFLRNPKGSMIVNGIPPTDTAVKNTVVGAGYVKTGTARVVAYRQEQLAAVNELKAANPSWDLFYCDLSTAYANNVDANFVETGAGNHVHPSVNIGQPNIAALVWVVVQQTKAFINGRQ